MKSKRNIDEFTNSVKSNKLVVEALSTMTTQDAQKKRLSIMERIANEQPNKEPISGWRTSDLVSFSERNKFAKVSVSVDGRKHKFEFSRIDNKIVDEIQEFIMKKLS
ncbi:hypothetical protein V4V48_002591 [Vibrio mimicus]